MVLLTRGWDLIRENKRKRGREKFKENPYWMYSPGTISPGFPR